MSDPFALLLMFLAGAIAGALLAVLVLTRGAGGWPGEDPPDPEPLVPLVPHVVPEGWLSERAA